MYDSVGQFLDSSVSNDRSSSETMDDRSLNTFLTLLLLLLCLSIVMFLILYIILDEDSDANSCNSSTCKSIRDDLLKYMHRTSDPCQNFYKFCCGKFVQEEVIPRGYAYLSSFQKLEEQLNARLDDILRGPIDENSPLYEVFIKKHFRFCTDVDAIEKVGIQPILDLLKGFGDWPLIEDSFDEDNVNLTYLLIKLKAYQVRGFFYLVLSRDEDNDQRESIFLIQSKPTMPRGSYSKPAMVKALRTYLLEVAHFLSGKVEAELGHGIDELIEFEKNISELLIPSTMKIFMPLKNIAKHVLVQIFNESFNFDQMIWQLYTELDIAPRRNVSFLSYDFNYLYGLSKLLERSSMRTIVNYLVWELIQSLISAFPDKFRESAAKFRKETETLYKRPIRHLECLHLVEELDYLYSATYTKRYFKKSSKDMVLNLVEYLKESYKIMIGRLDWMTDESKVKATEKISAIHEDVGYPDFLDDPRFNDLFKKEYVELNNFLEYLFFSRTLAPKVSLAAPMVSVIVDEIGSVAKLNAYYNHYKNSIEIPAGMLQWPFFSESAPMYFNFGGIGHVIGHELSHALDKKGGETDIFGNLLSGWKKEDLVRFEEASRCLIDQYNLFVVDELNMRTNGKLTFAENVADNGGMKGAYLAYMNWVKRNGPELKLPGLPYTSEQLFFIAFGRIFCTKARPQHVLKDLLTNNHAQERFRVNGPVMNSEEFSKVFQCPAGSPMNPVRKCKVW